MIESGDIVTFYPIEDENLFNIIADKFYELFLSELDEIEFPEDSDI